MTFCLLDVVVAAQTSTKYSSVYTPIRQIIENNEIKIIRSEQGEDLVLLDSNKISFYSETLRHADMKHAKKE